MNAHGAARLANVYSYEATRHEDYIDGAPHVKHESLRRLHRSFTSTIVSRIDRGRPLRVLDLGAGEGSTTAAWLDRGASVVAVDTSERQLARLRDACLADANRLDIRCADAADVLERVNQAFDVVVACSFLHHVPDYLTIVDQSAQRIAPGGFFFSFQDLRRYDLLPSWSRVFSALAYYQWRARQGDVLRGVARLMRRSRGFYDLSSPADTTEFHLVRGGVDEHAISKALQALRFDCQIVRYFSTQSPWWQRLGEVLHVENTFAVIAQRTA